VLQKTHNASFNGLQSKLQDAQNEVHAARRELLRNHPHVTGLLQRLQGLRAELARTTSDLAALAAVGGIEEGWNASLPTNPAPSPALAAWIAALLTDANAEISQ
jgi:hypothetical protein